MGVVVQAVLIGMAIVIAGTIPRNLLFAANLRYFTVVPWAVPLEARRANLRANRLPGVVWFWSLIAGGLGIVALVLALRVVNRLVVLPRQGLPDRGGPDPEKKDPLSERVFFVKRFWWIRGDSNP